MAIPFPPAAVVRPFLPYTPKNAFRTTTPPTNVVYFDGVTLQGRQASVSSNDGKTLVINAEGTTFSFDLTGDGSQCIPVMPVSP